MVSLCNIFRIFLNKGLKENHEMFVKNFSWYAVIK